MRESKPDSWLYKHDAPPLADVFGSVEVPQTASSWRKFFAFLGPGFLVSVGYMDPGNWATALEGGSMYGYRLLWVALVSNLMAILLQSLTTRLAIASGRDLAQACRDAYGKIIAIPLWILAEVAIIATDIAEVIGTAIGLQLLFGISLKLGAIITALDVFIVLLLQRAGFRKLEAFVISLLAVIMICFVAQMVLAKPDWVGVANGFVPSTETITDSTMLYLALGIIGATVMPHNLYLHSGIVLTRAIGKSAEERRQALRYANFDSTLALLMAFTVNAAILILAAATFHRAGINGIGDIAEAKSMLGPLVGSVLAPKLFAIALLACGLNSAVTATLAGQIVMEGFINLRLPPWARRLVTRALAIIPAIAVIFQYGNEGTGFILVLSQVILAMQLPFAVVPLVALTASRRKMGALAAPWGLTASVSLIALAIIALNVKFLISYFAH